MNRIEPGGWSASLGLSTELPEIASAFVLHLEIPAGMLIRVHDDSAAGSAGFGGRVHPT